MTEHPITIDMLEEGHTLLLGQTRSGKTYQLRAILEKLRRADRRVGAIDKLGNHWGLTVSADGERPGLDFIIFGGKRGHVPMQPGDGARLELERFRGVDAECDRYQAGLGAIERLVDAVRNGKPHAALQPEDANLHSPDANSPPDLSPAAKGAAPAGNPAGPAISPKSPATGAAPRPRAQPHASKASGASESDARTDRGSLPPRRVRILDAISWLERYLKRGSTPRGVVAWLAETTPNSSTFEKDLSAMRTLGLIDYPGKGELALTTDGRSRAAEWPPAVGRPKLWEAIAARLPPRRVSILRQLWDEPDARTRSWLASGCGTTPNSSTFEKDLSAMRTLGLIDYPATGMVELAGILR